MVEECWNLLIKCESLAQNKTGSSKEERDDTNCFQFGLFDTEKNRKWYNLDDFKEELSEDEAELFNSDHFLNYMGEISPSALKKTAKIKKNFFKTCLMCDKVC